MIFFRVMRIFQPKTRVVWGMLISLTVLTSILDGIGLTALIGGMKVVLDPDIVSRVTIGRQITTKLAIDDANELALWIFGGLACFYAVKNIFTGLVFATAQRFIWRQRTVLSQMLFTRYLSQKYTDHINTSTAVLQRNIISVGRVCDYVLVPMLLIVADIIVVISLFTVILFVQPMMTLGLAVLIGLGGAFYLFVRKRLARWSTSYEKSEADIIRLCQQSFAAFRDIRLYGRGGYFAKEFREQVSVNSTVRAKFQIFANLPRLVMETAMIGGLSLAMIIVVVSTQNIIEFLPFAAALVAAATRMGPSINRIAHSAGSIRFGRKAFDEIHNDLVIQFSSEHHVLDSPSPEVEFNNEITFDNIGFRYPGSEQWALRNISLTIKAGESIGVVGRSGSGKTTFAHIVLGFLTPDEGRILVDGTDVTGNAERWQSNVAFVPQDVFLLDDTLAANVAFGEGETHRSAQGLESAIEAASLSDVVSNLEDGVESVVGERGAKMSGGQRQRIAIARALYHGRRLLVLDEATSALDTQTENEVTKALESIHSKTSTIVIAHRLSTIKNCDRVLVFVDGKIESCGSYSELKIKSQIFEEMDTDQKS